MKDLALLFNHRQRTLYAVAALLFLFEGIVISLIFFPRVDQHYIDYYINKTTDCWALSPPPNYSPNQTIFLGTEQPGTYHCTFTPLGWSFRETWGTWTNKKRAVLRFNFHQPVSQPLTLIFKGHGFAPKNGVQKVDLLVNNHHLKTAQLKHGEAETQHFPIPLTYIKGEKQIEITFQIHDPASPAEFGLSDDSRMLGVGLHWVRLDNQRSKKTAP